MTARSLSGQSAKLGSTRQISRAPASAARARPARTASWNSLREAIGSSWSSCHRGLLLVVFGSRHQPALEPCGRAGRGPRRSGGHAPRRRADAASARRAHQCGIAAAGAERLAVEEDDARRRRACGVRRSSDDRRRRADARLRRARTRCRAWARSAPRRARAPRAMRSASSARDRRRRRSAAATSGMRAGRVGRRLRRGRGRARRRSRRRLGVVARRASASRCSDVGREARRGRRAKADRRGDALADGDAVVAPARRQVEHVAGLEQPLLARLEVGEHLQRHVVAQARPSPRGRCASAAGPATCSRNTSYESTCGPTPPPSLAYEHHDVVEARVGHEAEALQQPMRRVVVQVDALHQQAPARRRQRRQCAARDRPGTQRPALAARGRPAATRRRRARPARTAARRSKPGSGSASARAHEQRLLLPVPAHERGGRQAAEQGHRPVRCPCFIVR